MVFGGLGISVSGLLAAQTALDVTSNNIANANTPGYSRRLVTSVENATTTTQAGFVSKLLNGVSISSIDRARNSFLDNQVRDQKSSFGYDDAIADLTINMNDILGEPSDSGLAAKLNEFFQAASDLAANPQLETAKTVFINAADSVADAFNQLANSIRIFQDNINSKPNGKINSLVVELNEKLVQLSDVHQQARIARNVGNPAAELEDKRDLLLDQVREVMDINIVKRGGGEVDFLTIDVNASEAEVTSTVNFSNYDTPIAALTAGANSLDLTINNGAGTSTGPFTVNFEAGSTARQVIEKINKTFRASGGEGDIASLSPTGDLVFHTSTVDSAVNSSTAAITIGAGSTALAALGLSAGTTNGTDATTETLMDSKGLYYTFDTVIGNNQVGPNPNKLIIRNNDTLQNAAGFIDSFSGSLGGHFEMSNNVIPEMREELSNFAMSIKDAVNKILSLGTTTNGNTGSALFTGTHAGDIAIDQAVVSNPSLLAQGKTGAISDGAIAAEISDLFFGNNNIISDLSVSEKTYIDSPSTGTVQSQIAIIPGETITIHADGLIDDNGSPVNAGVNGFGGGSLVQFEFLDASGAVVGTAIDFPASAGAPTERVSYTGTVPATAAFVRFRMNNTTFNDNDVSNNSGHFGLSVLQGADVNTTINLNNKMANIVGDFGTRGNVAISKAENSQSLLTSLEDRSLAITGVSVEEEASNLIRYQNAYAANARVISTWNQVFDSLLTMI